jgi:sterol desaturase/sphingolipid hydroxylase (fatty acid hydroxylase superfamily)
MNELFHSYLEALPGAWLLDTGRYAVAASTMAAMLAIWAARLAPRKLQSRNASGRDIRREILASLRSAMIFSLLGALVVVCSRRGWMTVYAGNDRAGPVYLVLSLAAMLVVHDAYFYWTHRAMHHRRLFAFFHRTHHLSRTPTPWAAYAFSVPEAIVQGAFVPLFLIFVPMHALALFAFVAIQITRNVMGHAGIEVHPRAFGPGRCLGWNNTTTYHDLHHELGRYNYGLYFRWWDRLMGTEHPDYRGKFEAITSATPRADYSGATPVPE